MMFGQEAHFPEQFPTSKSQQLIVGHNGFNDVRIQFSLEAIQSILGWNKKGFDSYLCQRQKKGKQRCDASSCTGC